MGIRNSDSRIRKLGFYVFFYHLLTRQLNSLCFRCILHKLGEIILVTTVFEVWEGAGRREFSDIPRTVLILVLSMCKHLPYISCVIVMPRPLGNVKCCLTEMWKRRKVLQPHRDSISSQQVEKFAYKFFES